MPFVKYIVVILKGFVYLLSLDHVCSTVLVMWIVVHHRESWGWYIWWVDFFFCSIQLFQNQIPNLNYTYEFSLRQFCK